MRFSDKNLKMYPLKKNLLLFNQKTFDKNHQIILKKKIKFHKKLN